MTNEFLTVASFDAGIALVDEITNAGDNSKQLVFSRAEADGLKFFREAQTRYCNAVEWLFEYTTAEHPKEVKRACQKLILLVNSIPIRVLVAEYQKDQAIDFLNKELAAAQIIKDSYWEAVVRGNLGKFLMKHPDDLDEAITHLEWRLEYDRENGNTKFETLSLSVLGVCYRRLPDLDKSRTTLEQAFTLAEEHNYTELIDTIVGNYGSTLWELGDLELAKEMYIDSLERVRQRGSVSNELHLLSNLAKICNEEKQFETALGYTNEAMAVAEQLGHTSWVNKLKENTIWIKKQMEK